MDLILARKAPMLARIQFCLLLALCLAAICLPAFSQINGVPASVTSLGFGGNRNPAPGVPASVTSLGRNGYGNQWSFVGNCCGNFFLPANPYRRGAGRHQYRNNDAHARARADFTELIEPVYIPYIVPYAPAADDDPEDDDPAPVARPQVFNRPTKFARSDESSAKAVGSSKPAAPTEAQLSTVLVFKDGHQSVILNYAIVAGTLFDFSAGSTHKIQLADLDLTATHKANDDRGVDFEIPANAIGQ
jgi:hypothetical protein